MSSLRNVSTLQKLTAHTGRKDPVKEQAKAKLKVGPSGNLIQQTPAVVSTPVAD